MRNFDDKRLLALPTDFTWYDPVQQYYSVLDLEKYNFSSIYPGHGRAIKFISEEEK